MSKSWLVVVLAGLLVVPLAGCKSKPPGAAGGAGQGKDIMQTATEAGNYTKFLDALKAAGMTDTLKGQGPYTVFAPTDDAFGKLPAGTLDELMRPENSSKLADILKYHIVAGRLTAERASKMKELDTMSGQRLTVTAEQQGKITVDGATVTRPDTVCSNGIIHAVDAVMMPPSGMEKRKTADTETQRKDIVATAKETGNHKTFIKALKKTGLDETLRGAGPFTVFAPTDAAFDKLPPDTLDSLMERKNREQLAEILKHHIAQGRVTSSQFGKTGELPCLAGHGLNVTSQQGRITVDGATVTQPDILASNGVIHSIDTVMMPPDAIEKRKTADDEKQKPKDIVATVQESRDHKTFAKALKQAGLADTLKMGGPFTVFAPTDEAFEKLPAGTLDNLMKPESREQLAKILKYHVSQQKVMSDRLGNMQNLSTLAEQELKVTSEKGRIMVDGATVTQPDIQASNGVIHSVDSVIMPPGMGMVDVEK